MILVLDVDFYDLAVYSLQLMKNVTIESIDND